MLWDVFLLFEYVFISLITSTQSRDRRNIRLTLSLFTFMDWRRKWQPTPVLTESDRTEAT